MQPRQLLLPVVLASLLAATCPMPALGSHDTRATNCAIAIAGSVEGGSTVSAICGIPPDTLMAITVEFKKSRQAWEELAEVRKHDLNNMQRLLDLTNEQIASAFEALGEKDVPPEKMAEKLIDIAQQYKNLRAVAAAQPGDTSEIAALRQKVQAAIAAGDADGADSLLDELQDKQDEQHAVERAGTIALRGDVILTRLRYADAARRYGEAAAALPLGEIHAEQRRSYLLKEASALKSQGEEYGDNAALASAIGKYRTLLAMTQRQQFPDEWANRQNELGNALGVLGERDSDTARLEEAVTVYHRALEEFPRERVPLRWAMVQNNLGTVLHTLGEREGGTGNLEASAAAYRLALLEWTRERAPLDWAMAQSNLGSALATLGGR